MRSARPARRPPASKFITDLFPTARGLWPKPLLLTNWPRPCISLPKGLGFLTLSARQLGGVHVSANDGHRTLWPASSRYRHPLGTLLGRSHGPYSGRLVCAVGGPARGKSVEQRCISQGHVAAQHIDELWKSLYARVSEERTDPSRLLSRPCRSRASRLMRGGPKYQRPETTTAAADALSRF